MQRDITMLLITTSDPIRTAIRCIDKNSCGIALVIDDSGHLLGTITDGDIRRAILAGQNLDAPVNDFLKHKSESSPQRPVTAPLGTDLQDLLILMKEKSIRQVPLLDEKDKVADLVVMEDVMPINGPLFEAVIMAGGKGARLRPLTEDLPKPMLPVGGRPLMERMVEQLHQAGIRHVNVMTHYKPEKIIQHFGDGRKYGVELIYVNEDLPLGTGGALGLLTRPRETQLVVNGDILTQVDFKAMLMFHQDNKADMTVAVRRYEMIVPYGVVECEGIQIRSLKEKPQLRFFVNAGIYLLEPSVYEFIPTVQYFNMTDLIQWLLDAGQTVVSFPIREYWLDIGEYSDYKKAQDDIENGTIDF